MWVTQTYLGCPDEHASVWVYYLYEDYNDAQVSFTNKIHNELQTLGEIYGEKVTFMIPQVRYAATIEKQVRGHRDLWERLSGRLPGILISQKPLSNISSLDDDNLYISFGSGDAAKVRSVVLTIRCTIDAVLREKLSASDGPPKESLAGRIFDALELKPGLAGFRIDLKKFMRRSERR